MKHEEAIMRLAARAAADGNHADALALLDNLPGDKTSPAAADLRARIHAQCGDYDKAAELWRAALAQKPDDKHLARALATAEKYRDKPLYRAWRHYRGWTTLSLIALLLVCGAGFMGGRLSMAFQAGDVPDVDPVEMRLDSLAASVNDIRSETARRDKDILAELDKRLAAIAASQAEAVAARESLVENQAALRETVTAALRDQSEQFAAGAAGLRTALEARLEMNTQRLDEIEAAREETTRNQESLLKNQTELRETLASLEQALNDARTESGNQISGLITRFDGLVADIRLAADNVQQGVGLRLELSQRIQALQDACAALDEGTWGARRKREQFLADLEALAELMTRVPGMAQ